MGEHYLDSLETLPGELRRNFTKMTDKDVMNKDIMVQIDGASDDYLRKVRDLSPTKRKAEMEKIQHMFKKAKELSDEKVNIAVATYEMIDKHIRKLDSDLAKFESEMKDKGRLSQTESEEEEVDDKRKKKKAKKVENLTTPLISYVGSGVPQEVLDMPVDPNEPTYCTCQQVYGEMIGCDNQDCPIEWFHFGCMDLTHKPKGKWYCPKCLPMFKKKGR